MAKSDGVDTASVAYQLGFALFVEADRQGLSGNELAKKVGMSQGTVARVLRGEGGSLATFEKLFAELGIQPEIKPKDRHG